MNVISSLEGADRSTAIHRGSLRDGMDSPQLRRVVSPREHYIVRPLPRTSCKASVDTAARLRLALPWRARAVVRVAPEAAVLR